MIEEEEIWLPVIGFVDAYEVSSLGRVRSVPRRVRGKWGERRVRERVLKQRCHPFGYPMVTLSAGGRRADRTVHALVAEAFLGPRPDGCHVAHNDGQVWNSRAGNLRYATPGENNADKLDHGTHVQGEDVYNAIRKKEQIVVMRERRAAGEKLEALAVEFGVSVPYVHQICAGQKWKSAGGPITKATKQPRVMSNQELERARQLREGGATIRAIAREIGVSRNQVWEKLKEMTA